MPTKLLYLLGMLTGVAAVSTDLYLPAMPNIANALKASPADVQMTLGIFFLGYGFGQLIYGPLSDSLGRRPVLLGGLALYIAASILCALSNNIDHLLVARLLQALGGCAGAVVPRAIISDCSQGSEAAKALSTAMAVTIIGPIMAPSLGGAILLIASWQAIFWILTTYGLLCFFSTLFYIEESLPQVQRQHLHWRNILRGYRQALGNRHILLLVGAEVCASMSLFTFITGSAFVYVNHYQLSAQQYGVLFSIVALGVFIGSVTNTMLVTRLGLNRTLQFGLLVCLTAAALMLASILLLPNNISAFTVMLWCCLLPSILIRANIVALGLSYMPERSGTVSAIFGAAGMGIGGVAAGLVSAASSQNPLPMATMIATGYLLSALLYYMWYRDQHC